MDLKLFCQYQFKFYLNASHFIVINGKQGETHPHTWEITLTIQVPKTDFTEFGVFEKSATAYISQFQNKVMNDIPPFNTIVPTLENIIDHFGDELNKLTWEAGAQLMRIEGSETPTRSYIVNYDDNSATLANIEKASEESMSRIMDKLLDEILA